MFNRAKAIIVSAFWVVMWWLFAWVESESKVLDVGNLIRNIAILMTIFFIISLIGMKKR